jgi:hypothetical protein
MTEIVYSVASSLDGYIATVDGGVNWLSRFHSRPEDRGAGDLGSSVDALLLGSHTYEFALKLGSWPSPNKPSWVFTKRNLQILHPSITLRLSSCWRHMECAVPGLWAVGSWPRLFKAKGLSRVTSFQFSRFSLARACPNSRRTCQSRTPYVWCQQSRSRAASCSLHMIVRKTPSGTL